MIAVVVVVVVVIAVIVGETALRILVAPAVAERASGPAVQILVAEQDTNLVAGIFVGALVVVGVLVAVGAI